MGHSLKLKGLNHHDTEEEIGSYRKRDGRGQYNRAYSEASVSLRINKFDI